MIALLIVSVILMRDNKEYIEREAPRYINANILKVAFERARNCCTTRLVKSCWTGAINAVDYAPTEDVVPVVHGEWLPNPHHYGVYVCSKCQCADQRCQPNFEEVDVWKSCPNCGAKMDGGKVI